MATKNKRNRKSEQGTSTVEWAGLLVVMVVLLLAVAAYVNAASGNQIGGAVLDNLEQAILSLQGGGTAVSGADAPGAEVSGADIPDAALPSLGLAQAAVGDTSAPASEGGDSGGGGFLGQVGGFFVGIFEGGRDLVVGVATLAWDGVRGLPITGDIYGIFDPEGRDEVRARYGALVDAFIDDPLGTGGAMLYAMVEPIVTDWNEGRYGEAIGRGVFEAVLLLVPGDEVGKISIIGRIDRMAPDELLGTLARLEQLTPDEFAAVIARMDRMSPDEMADLLRRIEQMSPDELTALGLICSFSAETVVTTKYGARPIHTLAAGDFVLAYHEKNRRIDFYPITAVWAHTDAVVQTITLDGETIITTPEHPFFTVSSQWEPALLLQAGDQIRRADGRLGTVQEIRFAAEPQTMYNLTVADAHTFFVGNGQWLVHNGCNYSLIYERLNRMTPEEFSQMVERLGDLSPEELRALTNYSSRWEDFFDRVPFRDEHGAYNLHHGYPRNFREFFRERGIDIDNPQNMFELPQSLHTRLPDGIHTGAYPESWNGRWAEWINTHPNATYDDIVRFLDQLEIEFGIGDYRGQAPSVPPPGIPPRLDN